MNKQLLLQTEIYFPMNEFGREFYLHDKLDLPSLQLRVRL